MHTTNQEEVHETKTVPPTYIPKPQWEVPPAAPDPDSK